MKLPKEIFKNNLRESLNINLLFNILGSYNIKKGKIKLIKIIKINTTTE